VSNLYLATLEIPFKVWDWCQELRISAFKPFTEQKIATKITYAHYREGAMRQRPVCLWLNLLLLLLLLLFFRKAKHE